MEFRYLEAVRIFYPSIKKFGEMVETFDTGTKAGQLMVLAIASSFPHHRMGRGDTTDLDAGAALDAHVLVDDVFVVPPVDSRFRALVEAVMTADAIVADDILDLKRSGF